MEGAESISPPITQDSRITVSFVNAEDDRKKVAREVADDWVRENQRLHLEGRNPLNWARGIFKSVRFNLGEKYYKYTKAQEVEREQVRRGQHFLEVDSVTGAVKEINDSRSKGERQLAATASRFTLAAEGKTNLQNNEAQQGLVNSNVNRQIGELISQLAKGDISIEQFKQNRQPIIDAIKNDPNTAPYITEANFVANNLLEMALKVKYSYERGLIGLDNLDQKIDLQLGNAVMAATTEYNYGAMERFMNWTKQGRYRGWAANPLVAGVAIGLIGVGVRKAVTAGLIAASVPLTGGLTAPIAGAVVGGLFAAGRRWTKEKAERQMHEREASYSKGWSDRSRSRLEGFRYNRADGGGRVSGEGLSRDITRLAEADLNVESDRNNLLVKVAEIDARINFGIQNGIDLMVFRSRHETEVEKLELVQQKIIAVEKVRSALRTSGMSEPDITREIDSVLNQETQNFWNQFNVTRAEQNHRFNVSRAWSAARAGALGVGTGLAGGFITQEALAGVGRLLDSTVGTHFRPGSTMLENAISGRWNDLMGGGRAPGFAVDQAKELFADTNPRNLEIRPDIFLNSDGHHNFSLIDDKGNLINTPPVHVDVDGKITFDGKLSSLPTNVKDALTQPNWASQEIRAPGFGVDMTQDLYQNGGQHELSPGIILRALAMNPDGTRQLELIDSNNPGAPSVNLKVDSGGRLLLIGNPNNLPNVLKAALGQPGWSSGKVDGTNMPGLNLDRARDFFQDPVKYGGRLGISTNVRIDIDPELANGDRQITFHDVSKGGVDMGGPLVWLKPSGQIVVGGDPAVLPPEVKNILDSFDKTPTIDHNLQYYVDQTVRGPTTIASDQVVGHGVSVNTWDIKESEWRNIEGPSKIPGMQGMQGLSKDEWVDKHGIKDPLTGLTSIKNMSFTFDPREGGERIQITGNLEPNLHQFHFSPNDQIAGEGNAQLNPQQISKALNEITSRGWKVETDSRGGFLVTFPEAQEYTPPSITSITPAEPSFITEFTPPEPDFLEPPDMIPTPLEWESPLGPVTELRWYPNAVYPPRARLHQVLKRVRPDQTENTPKMIDEEEGKLALEKAKEGFDKANHIYIVISSPQIGDNVVGTAYLSAVQERLRQLGKNTPITLVVNSDHRELYAGLESTGISIVSAPALGGIDATKSLINSSGDRDALIIDLERYRSSWASVTEENLNGTNAIAVRNILGLAVDNYNLETDKYKRASRFIEELFMIPKDTINPDKAQTRLVLPDTVRPEYKNRSKRDFYDDILRKYGIDPTKPQITILLGGSWEAKLYGLENWAEVISLISQRYPGYQFNFSFQDGKPPRSQIQQVLRRKGITNQVNYLNGSFIENAVLLERQEAVLGNDTGLAHAAAAIEGGPHVINVFAPEGDGRGGAPARQWATNPKQHVVELTPDEVSAMPFVDPNNSDDSKKIINHIPPSRVVKKLFEFI